MKRAHNFVDLSGMRFGLLIVKRLSDKRQSAKIPLWECVCECGQVALVNRGNLRSGKQISCGCYRDKVVKTASLKHGHARGGNEGHSKTFRAWSHMRGRCSNPRDSRYKWYGAIGISVCKRWESFDNFLADMGEAPADKSLDRINPFGNYEPSNCRWSTIREQRLNTRRGWTKRGFKPTDHVDPSYWSSLGQS